MGEPKINGFLGSFLLLIRISKKGERCGEEGKSFKSIGWGTLSKETSENAPERGKPLERRKADRGGNVHQGGTESV